MNWFIVGLGHWLYDGINRLDRHEVHLAKHDEQIKTLFEKERNHE